MRGIMGLRHGGQVYPGQSARDRSEFLYRQEMRDPDRISRMLMEMAGHEFPEPTERDRWLEQMICLDSLGVQRGERPMLEDKPWWVDVFNKIKEASLPRELRSPKKQERLPEVYGPSSEGQGPMGSMPVTEVLDRLFSTSPAGAPIPSILTPATTALKHLPNWIMEMMSSEEETPSRASGGIIPGYEEGGPTPSAVQTYDYGVPQQTEQQWADLTDRVVDEGSRQYTPYGGQRLAGFTPQEVAAQQATQAYSTGEGPQGTIDAQGSLQTAGQQQSTAGSLDPYMSQYTQNVTDPQLRQLAQFNQQQMQNLGSQAAGSGAFGGYRQGVMQQQQAMDTSQQASDIIGTGQQQAFQNAQQALQADRQAALGAGQAQATLGGQQQAQQRQRTGDLGMVGQQRRDLQQKSLDVGYQDFQNRLNQERKNIDWQTGAMSNLPYKPGVTQTTYGTGPSDWSKTTGKVLGQDDVSKTTVPGQRHGGIVGPMYSQFLRGMRR